MTSPPPVLPPPPFKKNDLVDDGQVRVLSFVGQGSFAHVYKAYDFKTDSICAVKCIIQPKLEQNATLPLREVKREVHAMEDLAGHPNIVRLMRVVEYGNWMLIIMEFCEIDLYDTIMQNGGLPDAAVRDVFGQLCDAVLHCHARGYFHRDIKPENCLIDIASFTVKLTDFGLVTRDTWSYEMGCGSSRYISPEGCLTADPRKGYSPAASDTWALGIILINLLFSKNPWFEATPSDPIFSSFVTDKPDILQHHFGISEEFDAVLRRIFALDPSKRLPLAEMKLKVLGLSSFLRQEPPKARPVGPPPPPSQLTKPARPTQKTPTPFDEDILRQKQKQEPKPLGDGPLVVVDNSVRHKTVIQTLNPFIPFIDDKNNGLHEHSASPTIAAIGGNGSTATANANVVIGSPTIPKNLGENPFEPTYDETLESDIQDPSDVVEHSTYPGSKIPLAFIWPEPSRTSQIPLPADLSLGREGIGRIGISRMSVTRTSKKNHNDVGRRNGRRNTRDGEANYGLLTASDIDDSEDDDIDGHWRLPDEESHFEAVKVDKRLLPDLERGMKTRYKSKHRPFLQLSSLRYPPSHDGTNSVQLRREDAGNVQMEAWDVEPGPTKPSRISQATATDIPLFISQEALEIPGQQRASPTNRNANTNSKHHTRQSTGMSIFEHVEEVLAHSMVELNIKENIEQVSVNQFYSAPNLTHDQWTDQSSSNPFAQQMNMKATNDAKMPTKTIGSWPETDDSWREENSPDLKDAMPRDSNSRYDVEGESDETGSFTGSSKRRSNPRSLFRVFQALKGWVSPKRGEPSEGETGDFIRGV